MNSEPESVESMLARIQSVSAAVFATEDAERKAAEAVPAPVLPPLADYKAFEFHPHKPCKHIIACRKLSPAPTPAAPNKPVSSPRDTADQIHW